MPERRLPTDIPEKQPVQVDPATTTFLKVVDKSPEDPQEWGWKRIKRFIARAYNALRKKNKNLRSVDEFVDSTQVRILTAVGDPFVKNPPEDNLVKKGLLILRRWKAMADARK